MSVRLAEKFDRTSIFSFSSYGTDELAWIFHFYQRFYDLPMRRELLKQIKRGVSKLSYHVSMQPLLCRIKIYIFFVDGNGVRLA